MNSEQFLSLLESKEFVSGKVLTKLRAQVTESNKPVSATRIAMLLVEKGHLTSTQAEQLLESEPPSSTRPSATDEDELTIVYPDDEVASEAKPPSQAPPSSDVPSQPYAMAQQPWPDDVDDLTLASPDDIAPEPARTAGPDEVGPDTEIPVLELDDDPDVPEREYAAADSANSQRPQDSAARQVVDRVENSLIDEESAEPASAPLAAASGAIRRPRLLPWGGKGRAKEFKTKRWDSPLMLVGGGGLILLLLLGLFLFFYLRRGLGDELFQLAEDDYKGEFYSQSIIKYEKFLSGYPRHPKASLARVKEGLARMRQVVDGGNDWPRALDVAREVLPQIKDEEAFVNARPEVAGLLPEIYAGFAELAKDAQGSAQDPTQAQQYVDLSNETFKLIENSEYLPTSVRQPVQNRIESIQSEIELVVREIDRDNELTSAVDAMRRATAEGNTIEAYAVRRDLLSRYPRLAGHTSLYEAVIEVSRRERELVRPIEKPPSPLVEEHQLPTVTRIVMSRQTIQGRALGIENERICIVARGAAYGFDAATGRVLWRRFVGYETTSQPMRSSGRPGADFILVDGRRNELIRVESDTGKLVWRLPMEETFSDPVVRDDRVYLATRSGKFLQIDADNGRPLHGASLPQRLDAAPGFDSQGAHVYQIGRHSSLFVLTAKGLECREVFYLGHEDGTVAVPPVSVRGHLIVAENAGTDYSRLHVISTDGDGLALQRRGDPIRLRGQIVTPPAVNGARIVFVTDRGTIHVLQVDEADSNGPVREIAKTLGTADTPVNHFALFEESRLWIAQLRLSKYELLATRGELSQKWAHDDGDVFLSPLTRLGQVLVHVRRRRDATGISVSAIDVGTERTGREDGQPIWETEIAVPLAGPVAFDADRRHIVAVSSHGDVFEIDAANLRSGMTDKPVAQARVASRMLALLQRVEVDAKHAVYPIDVTAPSVLVHDRGAGRAELRELTLQVQGETIRDTMHALDGALLTPTTTGLVHLVDLESGKDVIHPFQPRMEPGRRFQWLRPALVDSQDAQFVISEARGTLYHVGRKDDPEPHLAILAQVELQSEVVAPLAAAGATGYLVRRGADGDVVAAFDVAGLALGNTWELKGRAVWGPERVGDTVLVACDAEGLICFDSEQNRKWTSPLAYGPLAGRPELLGGNLVLNSVNGMLWMIDAASGNQVAWATVESAGGQEADHFDVGEPLARGPVVVGRRLLLAGRDGTLHVTTAPNGSP